MIPNNVNFEEIQPYSDKDVKPVLQKLVKERDFLWFAKLFFPEYSTKAMIEKFLKMETIRDFQIQFIYPMVGRIIKKTMTSFTYDGLEKFDKNEPHIFISNHRDIILDSALLNYLFAKENMDTTEIAIGSNLLILKWIEDLAKLNKTFIVIRNVPGKKLYHYSYNLSHYIRYAITQKKSSIWIAQREGRTKDGDDRTQISVLKMMGLSSNKPLAENLAELNIVPLSISYEFEPCDISKVRELYNKMKDKEYKKSKLDDLTSMAKSFETFKGRVHYTFGTPLNEYLPKIKDIRNKNQFYQKVVDFIDYQIHKNYKLFPNNYVAADIYFETDEYSKYYTQEDKKRFLEHFEKAVSQIDGEREIIEKMFLKIYAYPVKNHFEALNKKEYD